MESEAGAGDEPGFPAAGEALDAGGLGVGQLDRGDVRRAGLAAAGGYRRAVGVEVQVIEAGGVLVGSARGAHGGGEDDGSGDRGADGGCPELGERGQRGMPADRVVCPGLGLVPGQGVLSRLEGLLSQPPLMPMKKKWSLAFRVHPGRY